MLLAGCSGSAVGLRAQAASSRSRPDVPDGGRRCGRAAALTAAPHLPSSRGDPRHARTQIRMFPRDADFATQQLQGIISELRGDPDLAPLLDDRKVAAAIKQIAADPSSLQQHSSNPKVMRVLERLLNRDLSSLQAQAFADAGSSPASLLSAMSADAELSSLLSDPTVRTALAQIRQNPRAGMARWGSDPLVSRALDLLEQALHQQGTGQVVDVVAQEVVHQHQHQRSD